MSKNPSLIDRSDKDHFPGDDVDLRVFFHTLWAGKWLIGGVSGLAGMVSVLVALWLPNIYTASALLAPAESSGSGLSSLMKQYSGLASLAGVPIPGGEQGSRAQLGMQLMKSRAFIADFVERRDVLAELMAVEAWDPISGEVIFDSEIYIAETDEWVRDVEFPQVPKPSMLEAHEQFVDILGVSEDQQTGYIRLSIDHQSPKIAAQWINWLVEDVNEAVRSQDVAEAEKSIEYLKEQVANTALADLQAMFFELIQSQTETVMLAEVRPEYVFKTIDPAVVPEERSSPNRVLICILGVILGGILGILLALSRGGLKVEQERSGRF